MSRWATASLVRYVTERNGDEGTWWLDSLDSRVGELVDRLRLADLEAVPLSNRSLVIRAVHPDAGQVAVKVALDPWDGVAAAAAMDTWAARGHAPERVPIPDDIRESGVDVRVWVPGPSVKAGVPVRIEEVTRQVFEFLAAGVAPEFPFPSAAGRRERDVRYARERLSRLGVDVSGWLDGMCGGSAVGVMDEWAAAPADGEFLCHADLTPSNVLLSHGRPVLIDPEPTVGSPLDDAGRWAVRLAAIRPGTLHASVSVAAAALGVRESDVRDAARFAAVTYAVYLLAFDRPVPLSVEEAASR